MLDEIRGQYKLRASLIRVSCPRADLATPGSGVYISICILWSLPTRTTRMQVTYALESYGRDVRSNVFSCRIESKFIMSIPISSVIGKGIDVLPRSSQAPSERTVWVDRYVNSDAYKPTPQ
jgi:hypothetical protein